MYSFAILADQFGIPSRPPEGFWDFVSMHPFFSFCALFIILVTLENLFGNIFSWLSRKDK